MERLQLHFSDDFPATAGDNISHKFSTNGILAIYIIIELGKLLIMIDYSNYYYL